MYYFRLFIWEICKARGNPDETVDIRERCFVFQKGIQS